MFSAQGDLTVLNAALSGSSGSAEADVLAALGNTALTSNDLLSYLVTAATANQDGCSADICTGITAPATGSTDDGSTASSDNVLDDGEDSGEGGGAGGGGGNPCGDADDDSCYN